MDNDNLDDGIGGEDNLGCLLIIIAFLIIFFI